MENHWGVQPQVEYFNPRGGKVACQGKDTCSERLTVEIHMWGSPGGGTMHMEAPSQVQSCRWHNSGVDVVSAGGDSGLIRLT